MQVRTQAAFTSTQQATTTKQLEMSRSLERPSLEIRDIPAAHCMPTVDANVKSFKYDGRTLYAGWTSEAYTSLYKIC